MIVARRGHGETQEVLILVNGLDDRAEEGEELRVLMRRLARGEKIYPSVGGEGPVVVLTGTVNSCKRFLMKQAAHTMAACNFFEDTHHDLVVICC